MPEPTTPNPLPLQITCVSDPHKPPNLAGGWIDGLPATLPAKFGRYQLLQLLGKGGMGAVYLAHDAQLDRQVALKIPSFPPNVPPDRIDRFLREARIAATLHHPNLCPVYDAGVIDGVHFLTMAYVEGKPLSHYIRPEKPQPVKQVVAIVRQLALAMQEAHDKGVIHRDLKPANVMINAKKQPVIMDFGLARRDGASIDQQLTQSGMTLGTPHYMSPEQVNGDLAAMGPCCDIYSLGVILYQMLTGCVPFQASGIGDLVAQIILDVPRPPSAHRPEIDPTLDAICARALAKKPADRYASCRDFAAALQGWLKSKPVEPATPDTPPATLIEPEAVARRRPQKAKTRPWIAVTAAAGVVLVILGIVVGLSIKGGGSDASSARFADSSATKSGQIAPPIQPRPKEPLDKLRDNFPAVRERQTRKLEPGDKSFVNSIGMRLTLIPAGEFWMGSPETERDRYPDESPRHKITISRPFCLGIYEVTQADYERVMQRNPSAIRDPKLPVQGVSWQDAVDFCARLSELEKEKAAGRKYRLPTEAEWEYACRAGGETVFHVGNSLSSQQANFDGFHPYGGAPLGPDLRRPVEVGSYPPNAWGLYDMHGNVWEWCADWADGDYYLVSPDRDPLGPDKSPRGDRILRGGAYDVEARYCRSANRFVGAPALVGPNIGFRVACDKN